MSYIDNSYINRMSYKFDMFVKKKDNLYNFRCPLCGDSKKNKTKSRGFLYLKKNNYFYMCHNCGASMNFKNFIKMIDKPLYDEYVMELWKYGKSLSDKVKKTDDPEYNMNFSYNRKRRRFDYDNVIKQLLSLGFTSKNMDGEYLLRINNEYLDPGKGEHRMSKIRTQISGLSAIQFYCKGNDIIPILNDPLYSRSVSIEQKSNAPSKSGSENSYIDPVEFIDFDFKATYSVESTGKILANTTGLASV